MYTPLYIKTENSLLNSTIKVDDLINYAKNSNIKSLSITDDNMFGTMEFYLKCIKNDIKPIIGLEYKMDYTIILYAKDYIGYKNLIKLSSDEKKLENIKKYNQNLICILPYSSIELYNEFKDIYSNIFIGYKNDDEYQNIKENPIYLNEISFLKKEDYKYLKYLYAIKENKLISEINLNKNDNYLKTIDEYQNIDKSIDNNYQIYNLCNLKIEKEPDLLPIYDCKNNDAFSYLKELCVKGLKQRFGNTVREIYIERLKYELDVINKMGFCNYFLIVQDYVNYAKSNNILVGPGRGSAAGSLVSYVLNITDVDPIKYNLLFERFLNPERVTMPDIDIDFEYNRREEVIDYCINKYGNKKVAGIITFGTMGAKQAIRDIARCNNIELALVDKICKNIDSNLTLKENYKQNKRLQDILNDSKLMDMYKVASSIEGLKRHTSNHAAGIVMCNKNLDEIIPIIKKDGIYLTAYSMEYLEDLGLLKMDFLALKNLTTITNIIDDINKDNIKINFNDIPINEEETLDLFKKGNTLGIFQFESDGIIKFLKKFKPDSFEDIFACLALYRPGPMDNIDDYIARKNGTQKIDYIIKDLEPILKPTYGIMIYQEQIMQVASIIADYSLGEADILRRAISKKKEDILKKEKTKFTSRAINKGYKLEDVEKIFNFILKFASYGFNRAHSVGYAFISYKMAYLKVHYNKYFLKNLLNQSIGSAYDTKKYINECKTSNIKILNPDINDSNLTYTISNNGILFPLSNIKNIGSVIASQIIQARNTPFIDVYDFIKRTNINKKALESLILAGAFDKIDLNRKTLIDNLDLIINYGELIKDVSEEYALKPIIEEEINYNNKELASIEYELFGFYLSNHPVTNYKNKFKNIIDIKDVPTYFDRIIDVVVLAEKKREIATKKNENMCFVTGTDEQNILDIVLFPRAYQRLEFKAGDILLIRGKVEKRYDQYQLIVNNLKVLE